jgi:hypothetical protein
MACAPRANTDYRENAPAAKRNSLPRGLRTESLEAYRVRPIPFPGVYENMKHPDMKELYRSPNGDTWFLARDPTTGLAFVRHVANASSGGHVTEIEIGAFLREPRHPEHEALLRLIGAFVGDTNGTATEDGLPAVTTDPRVARGNRKRRP